MDATDYRSKNIWVHTWWNLVQPKCQNFIKFPVSWNARYPYLPPGVVVQPPQPCRHQGFGACSLSSDWPLYFGPNFSWGRWRLVCNGQGGWWKNLSGMMIEFRFWLSAVSQYIPAARGWNPAPMHCFKDHPKGCAHLMTQTLSKKLIADFNFEMGLVNGPVAWFMRA